MEVLVLGPLEEMVKKVDRISKNPLDAAELEEKESIASEEIRLNNPKKWAELQERNAYEPALLERKVIKI